MISVLSALSYYDPMMMFLPSFTCTNMHRCRSLGPLFEAADGGRGGGRWRSDGAYGLHAEKGELRKFGCVCFVSELLWLHVHDYIV